MPSDKLAIALARLQGELPHIVKGTEGQVGPRRYKYAELSDVTAAMFPLMAKLDLVFTACPTLIEMGGETKFVLEYRLEHAPSGESRGGFYPLGTGNPQQLGSAITYARRYCLCAVTGVAPDEDDDAAAAAVQSVDELRALRRRPPEVDEHGAATVAEQTRMMTGPEPDSWRSTSTAENDQWYDQPPTTRDDGKRKLTQGQQKMYHARMASLGIKDRDEKLRVAGHLLGIDPPATSSDLSYRQAGDLLERLRAAGEGDSVAQLAVEEARRRQPA